METNPPYHCKNCGAPIPSGTTDQICPACLLSGVLAGTTETFPAVIDHSSDRKQKGPSDPHAVGKHNTPDSFPKNFGTYRLLNLLGQGGMGAVYEAEQLNTGRRVALKMLDQQLDSPDMRQRFLREGRLAASVRHPNSLYIYGSEEVDDKPVITMEIAGSGTLKDKLKKQGPLPVSEAIDAILDVISGLEEACHGGVLHRDIKPSNCFVYPDGLVKVGDYGLSVSTMGTEDSYITATGAIMGTPAYASPEQLRGDDLDVRADIYSVGATLFTLLTGKAPFEGKNAVQVVANAIHQKPSSLTEFRNEIPAELAQVVARCLAKEPEARFNDYSTLREALLPFSSKAPEPAALKQRMAAGWIDFIAALLIPYMALMFSVSLVEFHFGMFVERTLYSARYYFIFLTCGFLYFTIAEGIWGAGLGKWLFGLKVIRPKGQAPGLFRGFLRILIPIAGCEVFRISFLLMTLSVTNLQQISATDNILLIGASNVCPWITVLLTLSARPKNGHATFWDILSGTRVVFVQKSTHRPLVEQAVPNQIESEDQRSMGPYRVIEEMIPGEWIRATDPLLRRQVWLRRRVTPITEHRRHLARPGRLRWLQDVVSEDTTWDVFEAPKGLPFSQITTEGTTIPWSKMRHWLHDLASEFWAGSKDGTLPEKVSFDYIRITSQGAILLDEPDPETEQITTEHSIKDIKGQQEFFSAFTHYVEPTSVPKHARSILSNLQHLKFEKLSFLTGALSGLLDKPAEVKPSMHFLSTFLLPLYVGILIFMGTFTEIKTELGALNASLNIVFAILMTAAAIQLLACPIRWIWSHHVFGLDLVDSKGEVAHPKRRLMRWMIIWIPLFLPSGLLWANFPRETSSSTTLIALTLFIWFSAAIFGSIHPNRGLHDRLAGTWLVRR